jgi:hypothetical protein
MAIYPFLDERFTARGDDTDTYFIAQIDRASAMWWYGEHPTSRWAHVFRGDLTRGTGREARWTGTFIDVPKGLTCGSGGLVWEARSEGSEVPFLQRTAREGARNFFGGTQIALPPRRPPVASVARLEPGFVGDDLSNLTGVWLGNDGGTYYIREVSETGEIAWVGEHPQALPTAPGMMGRRWVNVFMGSKRGRIISGEWADVPKGEVEQEGTMSLFVTSEDRLTIIAKTGGFGGMRFVRAENLEVTLTWTSLTVVDQQEWFLEGDEPYFYALIALMDGTTVNLTARESSRANFAHSLIAPMLQANVGAGTVIDLSSLPPVQVGIRAVPGDRPELEHPVFAVAVRGAEKDDSSEAWQQDRLQNWIEVGGGEVNRALQRGTLRFGTDVARWHETFSWRNEDDLFGLDSAAFTHRQLLALAGSSTTLTFSLRGGNVHYDVRAELAVRGVRGTCRP